jgi:arginase
MFPRVSGLLSSGLKSRLPSTFTFLRRNLSLAPPSPDHLKAESGLVEPYSVSVIGVPTAWGQPLGGVEKGPQAVRDAGLRRAVTSLGWRYTDRGDIAVPRPRASDPHAPGTGKNSFAVGQANQRLCEAVRAAGERRRLLRNGHSSAVAPHSAPLAFAAAAAGEFVLSVGGDHSIAAGSIAGILAERPRTAVIWVDAHADLNVPGESPTGNLHGTPLAFLLRLGGLGGGGAAGGGGGGGFPPGWEWLAATPPLLPSRLVYIGLRDLDAGEKAAIRGLGLRAYTMQDIDRHGIGKVSWEGGGGGGGGCSR